MSGVRNINLAPEHARHPGWDADGCHLRYVVTSRGPWGQIDRAGFGCEVTGGHCLPCDRCDKLREKYPTSVSEAEPS